MYISDKNMTDLENQSINLDELNEPTNLHDIIVNSNNLSTNCDNNKTVIHHSCFNKISSKNNNNNNQSIPQCPNALIYTLITVITTKPSLLDDESKSKVVHYFKSNKISAKGLVSLEYLKTLNTSRTKTLTWIKYEKLLCWLIKEKIYQPSTMANEVLYVVKSELEPAIASNFCSVINSCVKYCREVSNGQFEEEEEKWCEIIDWISWFLGTNDDCF